MANAAHTTRRALFAAATVFPAAAALPTVASASAQTSVGDWPAFIRLMEGMHPNGKRAALHAMAAGMRLQDMFMVMLDGKNAPLLTFKNNGAGSRFCNFDATGAC